MTTHLKNTFNTDALLYNKARPHYPEELFDTLISVTNLSPDARLLEIGTGTGQATKPLLERGFTILGIELGTSLAEVARDQLQHYKNVKIVTGSFEEIELSEKTFVLVYSATAFHWIQDAYKFKKTYAILKENGYLAIIHTNLVSDEQGDEFFLATQPLYKKYRPPHDDNFRLPTTQSLQPWDIDEKLFTHVSFETFPLVVSYSAREYTNLLRTYSPTIAMKPDIREKFL